jgi:hypothetical protein
VEGHCRTIEEGRPGASKQVVAEVVGSSQLVALRAVVQEEGLQAVQLQVGVAYCTLHLL